MVGARTRWIFLFQLSGLIIWNQVDVVVQFLFFRCRRSDRGPVQPTINDNTNNMTFIGLLPDT